MGVVGRRLTFRNRARKRGGRAVRSAGTHRRRRSTLGGAGARTGPRGRRRSRLPPPGRPCRAAASGRRARYSLPRTAGDGCAAPARRRPGDSSGGCRRAASVAAAGSESPNSAGYAGRRRARRPVPRSSGVRPGLCLRPPLARSALRDPVAHDLAGAEGHHPPRRDRHLDPGLRIAPDPLALVAQDEGAEARHLDVRALGQGMAHVVQDALDDIGRFGARQAELAVYGVGKVRARQRAVHTRILVDTRDPEIRHDLLQPVTACPRRLDYSNVTETRHVGNSTLSRIAQIFQYLSAAAPQVKPPPIASSTTMSPRLIRPSRTAVSNASGTDAAEVLACSPTVITTFSAGRPNFWAVASRIRWFAWCGTTQSTSAAVRPAASSTSFITSARLTTAWRNTSRPFIRSLPTVPVVEGPPSTNSRSLWRPSAWSLVARMPPSVSSAPRTSAPAPSPNSTQVARSSQSRIRLNVSAPITSAFCALPERSIESATDKA